MKQKTKTKEKNIIFPHTRGRQKAAKTMNKNLFTLLSIFNPNNQ